VTVSADGRNDPAARADLWLEPFPPMTMTKKSRALSVVSSAAMVIATTGVALGAGVESASAAPAFPAHFAAPYLQISTGDSGDIAADMNATGLKYYTLAFLTSQSGCTATWEDGGYSVTAFNSQIDAVQAAGGNVIISFGGAGSTDLAQTCTNVSSLTAAYANIVNSTGVDRLDFDVEGSVLSDTSATTTRDEALAALQAENPAVQVDFTLAVAPNGLPTGSGSEYALLQDAKSHGVKVSTVNIMTMDFGNGQNALADAESAAQDTAGQLSSLYGISTAAAYNMMGLTPIAGQNDDNENFTQANANTLESFAASNGIGELAFWEIDYYDKPLGYAYSRIFNEITGGTTTPPPTGATGPITGYEGLCLDDRSASTALFNPVQVYTCNGTNAQSWTVESNNTLETLGMCLDIDAAGTANGTTVDLYTCNGTAAQVWQHQSNGELLNPNSGKCLDDTGFGGSGTQAQIWACADSSNQQWNIP
jgi:chitinase